MMLVAGLVLLFFVNKCKVSKLEDLTQLQQVELSTYKDTVKVIEQKNGELSFQVKSVEIENDNLKESLKLLDYTIKDLKEKEIKWRQINNALKVELESAGKGETVIVQKEIIKEPGDTIIRGDFKWDNKYLSLAGSINENLISFDYNYKTKLDIVTFEKKKETVVAVFLQDPNASIISSNSVTVAHKKKWYEKPLITGAVTFGLGYYLGNK